MQTALQLKFLNFLNSRKKADEGFTLIELLVVIIIIGILAAIALPSLLGQANKAKQSEARNNVGAIMRGQQAAYLEDSRYSTAITSLGIGIRTATANYGYVIATVVVDGTAVAAGINGIVGGNDPNDPQAKANNLKQYVGVLVTGLSDGTDATTFGVLCESSIPQTAAGTELAANLTATSAQVRVPKGTGEAFANCADTTLDAAVTKKDAPHWKELGG